MVRLELLAKTAMFTGVLAIGIALGAAIGLNELQTSCVAAGKLPTAGTPLININLEENACWQGAKYLQDVANGSGVVGAALALFGGILDTYKERVLEVFG